MLKINLQVEYALKILNLFLDKEGEIFTAREICTLKNAPFDTVSKIMQKLKKHKILTATKGKSGGYTLSSDLKNLSFLKLTEIVEGKTLTLSCHTRNKCTNHHKCDIAHSINLLNNKVNDMLGNIIIYNLLKG